MKLHQLTQNSRIDYKCKKCKKLVIAYQLYWFPLVDYFELIGDVLINSIHHFYCETYKLDMLINLMFYDVKWKQKFLATLEKLE